MDFTKIGSGHLDYDVGDVIARDVLEASVALVEPMFAKGRLIYDGITCDAGIVARGDQEKLIQILVNLLSNAIKFTSPGGHLAMACAIAADTVLLRVSDTGIGIPSDKLEVIFDPFVQVDGRSLGPDSGIGLGLAISRGFARGMHGDLTVESTLGQGARFTLTLPRSLSVRPVEDAR
jgi:signal transduction histidine kinase